MGGKGDAITMTGYHRTSNGRPAITPADRRTAIVSAPAHRAAPGSTPIRSRFSLDPGSS